MARWRQVVRPVEPEPDWLREFIPEDWSDAAAAHDRLIGPRWRPDGMSAAAWRELPEVRRAGLRWAGAWLLWHEADDVDVIDALRARARARRVMLGIERIG